MRILVHGRFHPSVGGIETVVNLLAREWTAAEQQIVVVSNLGCSEQSQPSFPFPVVYAPGAISWFRLVKWSEAVVQFNLSLRALWPHLLLKRRLVVSHQSHYAGCGTYPTWREWLKKQVTRLATNIAASQATARGLRIDCPIIPNPYDHVLFHQEETTLRERDLIFVGRLVLEKGAG